MYTTERFMKEIWQGPDEEAAACRQSLEALGDGPESDRLRGLLARIILHFRRKSGPAWPAWPLLVGADGQPVTDQDIAAAVDWPEERIDQDIEKLVSVGLLHWPQD